MSGLIIRNFTGATSVYYHNGIPYDADGAVLVSEQNSYTWAGKPSYLSVDVGTVINVTDVGGDAGSYWRATDDGWMPLNGMVKLASKWGTVASPVASMAGDTNVLFTVSGNGSLVIPAAMLIPGHSLLRIRAAVHRTGATATANFNIRVGTAGTISDALAYIAQMAATSGVEARPDVEVAAILSSELTTTYWLAPGASSTSGSPIASMSTNINTDAAMTVSFGISSGNSGDTFGLVGYSVTLESI